MRIIWRTREVSTIHIETTKTHNNLDYKNIYVSNIANSFTWLVTEKYFQRSGAY